ncbi:MAG: hypothetical protein ABJE66_36325 [Deltaproteobacteria bacterium]
MREREDDNLVADDLIGQREREPREHSDTSVSVVLPLRRSVRQFCNHLEHSVDLIFELDTQT